MTDNNTQACAGHQASGATTKSHCPAGAGLINQAEATKGPHTPPQACAAPAIDRAIATSSKAPHAQLVEGYKQTLPVARTEQQIDKSWQPSAEYRYFVWDAMDGEFAYFKSAADRDRGAEGIIPSYLDDAWDEAVEQVIAGEVTHLCEQNNLQHKPEDAYLDEDGTGPDGQYWGDFDTICNYGLKPIDSKPATTGHTITEEVAAMTNPETHSCCRCDFTWRHGQGGSHSCAAQLKQRLTELAKAAAAANEYCQLHGIGQWGGSATAALIEDHSKLQRQRTALTDVIERIRRETLKDDPVGHYDLCHDVLGACSSTSLADAERADQYYLQDSSTFVGNDMLWWRLNGAGYTTDLRQAHVFTKAKAMAQHKQRDTDIPWPKAYIDQRTRPTVDMQHINRADALANAGDAQ